MVQKTWVQSQVASYQRLKKWYLIPPCLTLSNIRYVSRVKRSNPGKGAALSPTPRCWSYWKENLLVTLDYGRQLYSTTFYTVKEYLIRSNNLIMTCVYDSWSHNQSVGPESLLVGRGWNIHFFNKNINVQKLI